MRSQRLSRWFALRHSIGCAVSVFRKVYANLRSFNVAPGDSVTINYKLEIK